MHLCMPCTFLSVATANIFAGPKHAHDGLFIPTSPAQGKFPRCSADVGTIEIQPDALTQLINHLLGKTGVGAG
jgi:hypothetical protein